MCVGTGNRSQKPEARNQKPGDKKLLQDRAHHHPHPDTVAEVTGTTEGAGGDGGAILVTVPFMPMQYNADYTGSVLSCPRGCYPEESHLPHGGWMRCLLPGRPRVIHYQELLECQRDQRELGGEAKRFG